MPRVPQEAFPFCGASYPAISPVIDAQSSVNLYPEGEISSSKTKCALIGRPGISEPIWTLPSSPVRALWTGDNRMFAVGGTHFYELGPLFGSILTDFGAMPGSTGHGRCQIQYNAGKLFVMDSSSATIYWANPAGTMDVVWHGKALEYLDGFLVSITFGVDLVGTNPNQVNVSNLNDGATWSALDYTIRTGSNDLLTQLAVLNGHLWLFGEKSIEVWYNAGNADFPFARIQGSTINLGLFSPHSVVKFYNTIMWLGADDLGYGQVYMAQGLNPVRVSNYAIEHQIAIDGPYNARNHFAYGYEEEGHTFYVLNICDNNGFPKYQWVYDLTAGMWHRREYIAGVQMNGLTPCCFASVADFSVSGKLNFIGDFYTGAICAQGLEYPNDGGANYPIAYTRTAPHVNDEAKVIKYDRFELDGDLGTAAPILDYSNDGGRTWLALNRPLQQVVSTGIPGTFQRFFCNQLGRSRDRVFKVTITDADNLIRIANAYIDVTPGSEA
jgi:hypothetical protein